MTLPNAKQLLEALILRDCQALLGEANPETVAEESQLISRTIQMGDRLQVDLSLDRVQEYYFRCLHGDILPQCVVVEGETVSCPWDIVNVPVLLDLGVQLAVDVHQWL